jgi:hypothetical protein
VQAERLDLSIQSAFWLDQYAMGDAARAGIDRQPGNRSVATIGADVKPPMEAPMRKPKRREPQSRSLATPDVNHTLISLHDRNISEGPRRVTV